MVAFMMPSASGMKYVQTLPPTPSQPAGDVKNNRRFLSRVRSSTRFAPAGQPGGPVMSNAGVIQVSRRDEGVPVATFPSVMMSFELQNGGLPLGLPNGPEQL